MGKISPVVNHSVRTVNISRFRDFWDSEGISLGTHHLVCWLGLLMLSFKAFWVASSYLEGHFLLCPQV